MSPEFEGVHPHMIRVPRIRGDEPRTESESQSVVECSPHTWG